VVIIDRLYIKIWVHHYSTYKTYRPTKIFKGPTVPHWPAYCYYQLEESAIPWILLLGITKSREQQLLYCIGLGTIAVYTL